MSRKVSRTGAPLVGKTVLFWVEERITVWPLFMVPRGEPTGHLQCDGRGPVQGPCSRQGFWGCKNWAGSCVGMGFSSCMQAYTRVLWPAMAGRSHSKHQQCGQFCLCNLEVEIQLWDHYHNQPGSGCCLCTKTHAAPVAVAPCQHERGCSGFSMAHEHGARSAEPSGAILLLLAGNQWQATREPIQQWNADSEDKRCRKSLL